MHNFYVPATGRSVAQARVKMKTVEEQDGLDTREKEGMSPDTMTGRGRGGGEEKEGRGKAKGHEDQGSSVDPIIHPENRFRVFGMTARILVDAARVAYGEEPEFEANRHHGDEEMIARLLREGYLVGRKREGEESVRRIARF